MAEQKQTGSVRCASRHEVEHQSCFESSHEFSGCILHTHTHTKPQFEMSATMTLPIVVQVANQRPKGQIWAATSLYVAHKGKAGKARHIYLYCTIQQQSALQRHKT